jgi:cobalt-zinc-cadmium resistance protein CzcA
MITSIIEFSVRNKFIVSLFVLIMAAFGIYSMLNIPIDAVPDITNNQVQVVTTSSSLAAQEVEQFITSRVEMAMANIPDVEDIRSISRFGLSVVTIVFKDKVPILDARQYVQEQINIARSDIPEELGTPEMMPITTGLGEIYQYTLQVDPEYKNAYDPMKLRTIQDWIVKRQLSGIPGIIEVSSFGGFVRQFEVSVNPVNLQNFGLTISDVFDALEKNNQNSGGSYIEKGANAYYIRTEGLITNYEDIESIVVAKRGSSPVLIRHIAEVKRGYPPRYGAMTMDGNGETVGGITLMLKGGNSSEAIRNVHDRVLQVQQSLPTGLTIDPYLDRSVLVGKTIRTVSTNLIEGGLIVILILILLLGNLRAGLIVASVIPLAMLFAFIMMRLSGVSANLMSLGAIDFGIVVDGAVIVVEGVLHAVFTYHVGKKLTQKEMDDVVVSSSSRIISSAAFGVFIILVVFIPILTLEGIEGKMFVPMAQTVSFAILGALILSVTYVPMMTARFLKKEIISLDTISDKIIRKLRNWYRPILENALRIPFTLILLTVTLFLGTVFLFSRMGSEFIPTLEEGDLAMQMTIKPGSSLSESIRTTTKAERILIDNFPEVKHVVSKIGTAEVPTDPMAVEDADIMIILKEKRDWVSASSREELADKMKTRLAAVKGAEFEFTQPIQLRFNELMTGVKTDVAVKIYGENTGELHRQAYLVEDLIRDIPGTGDIKVEQTEGLPQMMIRFKRDKISIYGLNIEELNRIIRTAYAGETAGIVYKGDRRFDLVVRLKGEFRNKLELGKLFVSTPGGNIIPLSEVAETVVTEGPMQISREDAKRRISVGINVRNRDIASYIRDVEDVLRKDLNLPPGYYISYGGQFENLEAARNRLIVAVPVALLLIFILLYFTFNSIKSALIIYSTVPTAAMGGIVALALRGMPFSISAGIGFIALFGVAVLNGIVLLSYYKQLRKEGTLELKELILKGGLVRMRPVILTAAVASFGFLPMALSTSAGAEVQKPLATVVIGGLITSTFLTLIILPVIYYLVEKKKYVVKAATMILLLFGSLSLTQNARAQVTNIDQVLDSALVNNLMIQNAMLRIDVADVDRKTAVELGLTEFNYAYGNINSSNQDYMIEIKQNFGNPLQQAKKSNELEEVINIRLAELDLVKRQVIRDTRLQWQIMAFNQDLYNKYEEQVILFKKYLPLIKLKADEGEISKSEYGLVELQLSDLENRRVHCRIEIENALAEIRNLTLIEGPIEFTDTSYTILEVPVLDSSTADQSLLDYYRARIDLSQQVIKTAKAGYFPELNLGYFNQQINLERGFQGVIAEAHIPIWFRPHAKKVKRAKVEYELSLNEYNFARKVVNHQYNNWKKKLSEYLRLYTENHSSWDAQISKLKVSADFQLEEGEINYLAYMLLYASAMETRLRQVEVIYSINEAIIQLEYYQNKRP